MRICLCAIPNRATLPQVARNRSGMVRRVPVSLRRGGKPLVCTSGTLRIGRTKTCERPPASRQRRARLGVTTRRAGQNSPERQDTYPPSPRLWRTSTAGMLRKTGAGLRPRIRRGRVYASLRLRGVGSLPYNAERIGARGASALPMAASGSVTPPEAGKPTMWRGGHALFRRAVPESSGELGIVKRYSCWTRGGGGGRIGAV